MCTIPPTSVSTALEAVELLLFEVPAFLRGNKIFGNICKKEKERRG